jgi:UDP-N-acetylmuramoylalanine--D-glutamate ligase
MSYDDVELRGQPVAVLGLGIEGRDLGRFLLARGARVVAFDTRDRGAILSGASELESLGAEVRLGPIDPDAADRFSALYVSQSVLLHRDPFVLRMRALGRPVRSMLSEFLRRWHGPIAGITGSSGKTTVTSLAAAAFARAGIPHILGGNIGAPLLTQLEAGSSDRWAVLEISHTQLQLTTRSPRVAAVTNVTPNHLDQFSWDDYVALKRNLVRYQSTGDVAVLNATNPRGAALAADTPARKVWFNADVVGGDSFFVDGHERLVARLGAHVTPFLETGEIGLRGSHNRENVLAAAAVCVSAGVSLEAFSDAAKAFKPVAHRLEYVATIDGAAYYNDSIATSPERTLAGMRSFHEPLVLLLGGREKRLPLEELAVTAQQRARAVICFGEAGPLLADAMDAVEAPRQARTAVVRVESMPQAVEAAMHAARPGDVVLLSPACTSFDAYPNFEQRGEEFRRLVIAKAGEEGVPSHR